MVFEDNLIDMNNRFSNTFIGKKMGRGRIKPVYIDQFYEDDETGDIKIRSYNESRDEYKYLIFNKDDYIFDCPPGGMFFDGIKAIYIRRTPDRQWKRGYNRNVLSISDISSTEVSELGLETKKLMSIEIATKVFNPEYMGLSEGIALMDEFTIFSFPLSRKFAISQKDKALYYVVYYKEWIVGWVEDNVIQLPESTHHLLEELSQYATCRRV